MSKENANLFVGLMHSEFCDWDAKREGIVDDKGNLVKRPKTSTEKDSYSPLHATVRSMKRTNESVEGFLAVESMAYAWKNLEKRYDFSDKDKQYIIEELPFMESVIAGDSGYQANEIASGVTSGDVTNAGPESVSIKPKKKVPELTKKPRPKIRIK